MTVYRPQISSPGFSTTTVATCVASAACKFGFLDLEVITGLVICMFWLLSIHPPESADLKPTWNRRMNCPKTTRFLPSKR